MSEPVEAVLFDLDGTLVATMESWDRCWHDYAARHGHTWSDLDRVGTHGRGDWAGHLARVCGQESAEQVAADCVDLMIAEIRAGHVLLAPGADALLAAAAAAVPTGLVSASPRRFVHAVLAHFELREYFRVVVAGEDAVASKPHPAPYLHAAHLLDRPPRRCVAVEDSVAGIQSAHTAGMRVLAIPSWGRGPRPAELDVVSCHAPDALSARRWLCGILTAPACGAIERLT